MKKVLCGHGRSGIRNDPEIYIISRDKGMGVGKPKYRKKVARLDRF
jgi:hypothetical protein